MKAVPKQHVTLKKLNSQNILQYYQLGVTIAATMHSLVQTILTHNYEWISMTLLENQYEVFVFPLYLCF